MVGGSDIYGDQGLIAQQWQSEVTMATGNRIGAIQPEHQHRTVSFDLKPLISPVRPRIERVFAKIQNAGRNRERLLNKSVNGLATHMAIKLTSDTLRLFLRHQFGIDILTFQSSSTY